MSNYERPSFNKEWWQKVQEFTENNPEVGFGPEDTKQFVKYCVNKKMAEMETDIEELRNLADKLDSE